MKKQVFDPVTDQMIEIHFLRTNMQNEYNNGMNDADISNQVQKVYCFNMWLPNRKRWWEIFMWAFGAIFVNAYVAYIATNHLI